MLEKILNRGQIDEVNTRLFYRQYPKDIADDLLKRGIISHEQYEVTLESLKELELEYKKERLSK